MVAAASAEATPGEGPSAPSASTEATLVTAEAADDARVVTVTVNRFASVQAVGADTRHPIVDHGALGLIGRRRLVGQLRGEVVHDRHPSVDVLGTVVGRHDHETHVVRPAARARHRSSW